MHLLRRCFLERFPGRIVNTHSAPLPEFPGPHPIDDVLAAGVPETAATVHYVDGGVDTGPVIAAERVPVLPDDDADSLKAARQAVEHRLLPQVVPGLISVIRRALISGLRQAGPRAVRARARRARRRARRQRRHGRVPARRPGSR